MGVGPPLTITYRLESPPVEVAYGYSHMAAMCLLAVRPCRTVLAGPIRLTRDYFVSRTHFQEFSRRLYLSLGGKKVPPKSPNVTVKSWLGATILRGQLTISQTTDRHNTASHPIPLPNGYLNHLEGPATKRSSRLPNLEIFPSPVQIRKTVRRRKRRNLQSLGTTDRACHDDRR